MPSTDYAKLVNRIREFDSKIINNEISEEEIAEGAHVIGNEVKRIFSEKKGE